MESLGSVVAVLVFVLVGAMIAMQVAVRRRSRALTGKPLPTLPGPWAERLAGPGRKLVYFFSPSCAACRAITPRVRELAARRDGVFAIDVMQDMPLAQALGVMATPSTVEVEGGAIAAYHVGPIPAEAWARYPA